MQNLDSQLSQQHRTTKVGALHPIFSMIGESLHGGSKLRQGSQPGGKGLATPDTRNTPQYLLTNKNPIIMKRKKISLTVLLLLCLGITALQAQQSANAAGGDASGTGGTASYSVGQVAYTYVAGTNGSSNQGVQQPYEFFTTGIDNYKNISLTMSVFPNPTQALVNLKVEGTLLEDLNFELYDVSGKILTTQKISNPLTVVPLQIQAAGSYLLRVTGAGTALKTFTIIKTN